MIVPLTFILHLDHLFNRHQNNDQSSSLDYSEKILEQRLKLKEFKILLNRHCQPEDARRMLTAVTILVGQGDESLLDQQLGWLSEVDRLKFGSAGNTL